MSFGGGVRCLDASAPVRVEVRRPAGTGGEALTSSRADRTRTRVGLAEVSALAGFEVLLPGRTAGGRRDVRCLCGLAEVGEDARDRSAVGDEGDDPHRLPTAGAPQRGDCINAGEQHRPQIRRRRAGRLCYLSGGRLGRPARRIRSSGRGLGSRSIGHCILGAADRARPSARQTELVPVPGPRLAAQTPLAGKIGRAQYRSRRCILGAPSRAILGPGFPTPSGPWPRCVPWHRGRSHPRAPIVASRPPPPA